MDLTYIYCNIQENHNPNVLPSNLTVFRLAITNSRNSTQRKLNRNELLDLLTLHMPSVAWYKSHSDKREIFCKTSDDDVKLGLVLIIDSLGIKRRES